MVSSCGAVTFRVSGGCGVDVDFCGVGNVAGTRVIEGGEGCKVALGVGAEGGRVIEGGGDCGVALIAGAAADGVTARVVGSAVSTAGATGAHPAQMRIPSPLSNKKREPFAVSILTFNSLNPQILARKDNGTSVKGVKEYPSLTPSRRKSINDKLADEWM
jgi:hypothetical protein